MTILVDITFDIVTDESAQDGEAAESGFHSENEPMTFRELVQWMLGGEPSCYPARGETHEWVSQDQGETHEWVSQDQGETRSIHYSRKNEPRKAKYWAKAMRAAGLRMVGPCSR